MTSSSGAVWRLLLATAAWGLSFPTAKAVMLAQDALIPGQQDWFHSALTLVVRMAFAALIMGTIYRKEVLGMGWSEVRQGIELGLLGGVGMLFQTNAQHSIPASTSAFFTQFTCIFVPIAVAVRTRSRPSIWVMVSSGMVLVGCAVLSGVNAGGIAFGLGEWETIGAAALFTGQILALERERYKHNDMRATATVMFAVKALVFAPVVGWGAFTGESCHVWAQMAAAYTTMPLLCMTAILTIFSTVYGYATMTQWQPLVSSTQAGLIYATEPIFATVWALFLPGMFSRLADVAYPNEVLSTAFYWGASLVVGANLLLLVSRKRALGLT